MKEESIKDYVLKRTLPDLAEQQALENLEAFLAPRINAANKGDISSSTVDDVFDEILEESK